MRDRGVRTVWVGMILGMPALIEAASGPPEGSWAGAAARVAAVGLVVAGGAAFASRHRRRLVAGWHDGRPIAAACESFPPAAAVAPAPAFPGAGRSPASAPVAIPAASAA